MQNTIKGFTKNIDLKYNFESSYILSCFVLFKILNIKILSSDWFLDILRPSYKLREILFKLSTCKVPLILNSESKIISSTFYTKVLELQTLPVWNCFWHRKKREKRHLCHTIYWFTRRNDVNRVRNYGVTLEPMPSCNFCHGTLVEISRLSELARNSVRSIEEMAIWSNGCRLPISRNLIPFDAAFIAGRDDQTFNNMAVQASTLL